jgi:septal ring-binding cell division protein DamX
LKGPIPERQETDAAVRLAPGTVTSAAPAAPAATAPARAAPAPTPTPTPTQTARPAPAPAAPAAAAASGRVTQPEVLTSLTAGFYVQHIASPSRGNVEVFWRSRPVLRQAKLLELRRAPNSQTPNFVLVSGPFESMEQAQRFMAQPGLPRDMWLREASKISPLLPNP